MPRLGQRGSSAGKALTNGLIVSALAAGVAFLTNILMSRQLGPAPRGEVAFVLQLSYMLTPIVLLGIDRHELRHGVITGGRRLPAHLTVACLILTLVALVVSRDWETLVGPVVYVLASLAVLRSAAFRTNSFKWYFGCMASYQLLICAVSIALYAMSVDNWAAWTIPYAAPAVLILGVVLLKHPRVLLPKMIFTDVSPLSLSLLPASVAAIVITRLDRVFLGILAPTDELGLYIAVATATELLAWLANSLADHRVIRYDPKYARLRHLLAMLARDLLVFFPLSMATGFGIYWWLLPLLGPDFTAGSALIIPLCLAAIALAMYRQSVSWNLGSLRPVRATFVEGTTAAFAVPTYFIAIEIDGALGAAWSSLLIYSLGCVVGVFAARGMLPGDELAQADDFS